MDTVDLPTFNRQHPYVDDDDRNHDEEAERRCCAAARGIRQALRFSIPYRENFVLKLKRRISDSESSPARYLNGRKRDAACVHTRMRREMDGQRRKGHHG